MIQSIKNVRVTVFHVLGVLFSIIFCISFSMFAIMSRKSSKQKIEKYEVHNLENRKGRGIYYKAEVVFDNKLYDLGVTNKEFEILKSGRNITIYYSNYLDSVYSDWGIITAKRVSILSIVINITMLTLARNKFGQCAGVGER